MRLLFAGTVEDSERFSLSQLKPSPFTPLKKTDNHNLKAKLELRRHLLGLANYGRPISVCDCYSGQEVIWGTLAKEFEVGEYLALDVKEKKGRLKLDSVRYLQNQQWDHDVVDLDAYGSPWRHYFEVIQRVKSRGSVNPLLVFLTIGNTIWKQQQSEALDYVGIPREVPPAIKGQLADLVFDHCLAAPLTAGLSILHAYEAFNPGGSCRYLGLQICKK